MRRQWRAFPAVDHHLVPVTGPVQQPENRRPRYRAVRLDDGQRGTDRDRRIERIAAGLEHQQAGLGGQRMGGGDRIRRRWPCRHHTGGKQQAKRKAPRGSLVAQTHRRDSAIGCRDASYLPSALPVSPRDWGHAGYSRRDRPPRTATSRSDRRTRCTDPGRSRRSRHPGEIAPLGHSGSRRHRS